MSKPTALLELYIALERRAAALYRYFHNSFCEDGSLWWQLCIEEEHHAALLRALLDYFPDKSIPAELLTVAEDELHKTVACIDACIEAHGENAFTRASAMQTALKLEGLSGEFEFQQLIASGIQSPAIDIFRQLCGEERDHARRISTYMQQHGLV